MAERRSGCLFSGFAGLVCLFVFGLKTQETLQ